jgi:alpha-beta hydrolase superfamily lysophospholipase
MVDEKKPETFVAETEAMATRIENRARDSLAGEHTISAREGLLRASHYCRIATAMVSPRKDRLRWEALHLKARSLFREAAPLFDPAIEVVEVPFEGTALPGYFIKAEPSDRPVKTLIMIGGGETFTEDLYFFTAPAALKRGYNFVTFDLPGQGGLPLHGKYFRSDTEVPIRAIVDYVLSRPDVDSERLAAYGISGGGYYVPRACAHDKRIKACVANSVLFDLHRIWKSSFLQFGELFKKRDPLSWMVADMIAWRSGCKNLLDVIPASRDFIVDSATITCPMLILIGEGEYAGSKEAKRQQHACFDALPDSRKKLVIAPHNEGAGHHCLGENLSLMSQIVFDWLDEVFV